MSVRGSGQRCDLNTRLFEQVGDPLFCLIGQAGELLVFHAVADVEELAVQRKAVSIRVDQSVAAFTSWVRMHGPLRMRMGAASASGYRVISMDNLFGWVASS